MTLFKGRHMQTSPIPYGKSIDGRQKEKYHLNSSWWNHEFYWRYLQECGFRVTYRNRHDTKTTVFQTHIWLYTNTMNLEYSAKFAGRPTD